jgi:Flp pilus assembly pilin Flp
VGPACIGLTARDGRQEFKEGIRGQEEQEEGGDGMSDWAWGLTARFRKEEGQALGEYTLILAFIAAVCVLALGTLGLALAGHLDAFATAFP